MSNNSIVVVVQKIDNYIEGTFELAYKYFSIMSVLNDLNLVKRDLQLIAYSLEQDLPVNEAKEGFVKKFGSSMATVGNGISKMYKLNILHKDKRVITINPVLLIDFKKDLIMNINFKHGDKG